MLKKIKKIMVVVAAAVMLSAGFATIAPKEASAHWADGAMDWGLRNGYITADLRDNYATRQDTWLIITRVANDLSGGSSYEAARKYVISREISDGSYPREYVKREDVVRMLFRASHGPTNPKYLNDWQASGWGASKGIWDGRRSDDPATRAEVMTMIRQAWLIGAI
ncbi:protein phosphatase 2C [Bacillus cereus]|uniref:protein phosphatase 2C n=1 Tax=Bacillus cereus TaxID=1396 RepID=UPI003EE06286